MGLFSYRTEKDLLRQEQTRAFSVQGFENALNWLVSDLINGADISQPLEEVRALWPLESHLNAITKRTIGGCFVITKTGANGSVKINQLSD